MAHIKFLLRVVGVNINLPLCMVLMDSSDTVFHGYRGELDLHRRQAEADQLQFAEQWHKPVYSWKCRQWAGKDATLRAQLEKLKKRFFGLKVKTPRWAYIEPKTDVEGDERRVNNLFISPSGRAAERFQDHGQIVAETVRDNSLAIRAAIKEAQAIEADTKVKVKWEQVLRLTAGERDVSKALTPPEPEPGTPPSQRTGKRTSGVSQNGRFAHA